MKTEKRECPHCYGSLERYEDPLVVKLIADAHAAAYEKGIRDAAENVLTYNTAIVTEQTRKLVAKTILSLFTKPKDKE